MNDQDKIFFQSLKVSLLLLYTLQTKFSTIIAFFPAREMDFTGLLHRNFALITFKHTTKFSNDSFLSPTSVLGHWQVTFSDMMVLALISTACISNIICSLQAMLIYARISNAMEAEDVWPVLDFYSACCLHRPKSKFQDACWINSDLRLNCCVCNCILRQDFCCNIFQGGLEMEWNFNCYIIKDIRAFEWGWAMYISLTFTKLSNLTWPTSVGWCEIHQSIVCSSVYTAFKCVGHGQKPFE